MSISTTIKTVALIGASGNIGKPILYALLATKSFTVTVLLRPDSKPTSYPAEVMTTTVASYDDESVLIAALQGQDAVIIAAPIREKQINVVDAAVKAGVKRFIPCDFSADLTHPKVLEICPFVKPQLDVIEHLKSKETLGLTWTSVSNGAFFEWGFQTGFYEFDFKTQTFHAYDIENPSRATFSTLATVGQATASILQHPEETTNRVVHIHDFVITAPELLKAVETETKVKWTVTTGSTFELEKVAQGWLREGKMEGFYGLLKVLVWRNGTGYDFGLTKANDNELLGVQKVPLEEAVRAYFQSANL